MPLACTLVETIDLNTIFPQTPGTPDPPAVSCQVVQTIDVTGQLPSLLPDASLAVCRLVACINQPPASALIDTIQLIGGDGTLLVAGDGTGLVKG